MTGVWYLDAVIAAAALVVAIATIWNRFLGPAVARPIARVVVREIGEALQPTIEQTVRKALEPIYKEMRVNGGESIKDRVRSMDERLRRVEQTLEDEITSRPKRRD